MRKILKAYFWVVLILLFLSILGNLICIEDATIFDFISISLLSVSIIGLSGLIKEIKYLNRSFWRTILAIYFVNWLRYWIMGVNWLFLPTAIEIWGNCGSTIIILIKASLKLSSWELSSQILEIIFKLLMPLYFIFFSILLDIGIMICLYKYSNNKEIFKETAN